MKRKMSYQCDFCKKLFHKSLGCKAHERRCYKNPKTKSCASCAFLEKQEFEIGPEAFIDFDVCLQNIDLTQSLKTKCSAYIQVRYDEEWRIRVDTPTHNYDRILAEQRLTDKLNWYREEH